MNQPYKSPLTTTLSEFLARRLHSGESPSSAVKAMIEQSASEIQKMHITPGNEERQWTTQQAWQIIRSLAESEKGALRYNEILLADAFSSNGEKALTALEQAELISVQSQNGRPYSIKPGRPIYCPAFKELVKDRVLAAKMDLSLLSMQIGAENKSIDKYEQELTLLGGLPSQAGELKARIYWLLGKVRSSQGKIEGYEKEVAEKKKVLQTEF